jgi:hypothetical protein
MSSKRAPHFDREEESSEGRSSVPGRSIVRRIAEKRSLRFRSRGVESGSVGAGRSESRFGLEEARRLEALLGHGQRARAAGHGAYQPGADEKEKRVATDPARRHGPPSSERIVRTEGT